MQAEHATAQCKQNVLLFNASEHAKVQTERVTVQCK